LLSLASYQWVHEVPQIPLIEDLTTEPLPTELNLLVEFDSKSRWYDASLTIAAGWLKTGGTIIYNSGAQPPDAIRSQLDKLGLKVKALEQEDKLRLYDIYTPSLGQKSKEKYTASLKVSDLSIDFSQRIFRAGTASEGLRVWDNASTYARFNDERSWIEFELTRRYPLATIQRSTLIFAIMKGVHSDWAYKQLEAAADGIIDFRFDEAGDETRNLLRISSLRQVAFNSRWHEVKFTENHEAMING
jgi:KaiC/GvpD/RAD55 family RecA-like ATPase